MRSRLEHFLKGHKRLAIAILLFAVCVLAFVIPKIFFSLESGGKTTFLGTFLLCFGSIMFVFFGSKVKKVTSAKKKPSSHPATLSYQQLLDETEQCSHELKKQQIWAYGCLIMGWIALQLGRLSESPPYNHPIFAIPVFVLAFLAATKSWEKENELDVNIAKCTVEGVKAERNLSGLKSAYFHDLAKSYEGSGMWQFAFIRISPYLSIIFSFLIAGPIPLLARHSFIPGWVINCGAGAIFGAAFLFFSRQACRPYYWLLKRRKEITT